MNQVAGVSSGPTSAAPSPRGSEVVVDLDAVRHNVGVLRAGAGVPLIAVVKADGYGHGLAEVARAAREAGAEWLGVASPDEARAVRAAGDTGPLLSWLALPGEPYDDLIAGSVDLTAYSVAELDEIAAAVARTAMPARVQLKVDTGLNRGGAARSAWQALFDRARAGERAGHWSVTGLWSHFACADEPAHPANDAQEAAFGEAATLAHGTGLRPQLRHLANSAAAVLRPSARLDAVRCGIAVYGLDPAPDVAHGADLRPAMTLRSHLALTKRLSAGDAVSYGHTWTAPAATTIGVVPLGYGDGIPRHASSPAGAEVSVEGRRCPVVGRVCMDQIVVDLGGAEPAPGTEVVVFGPGADGEPTAQEWARACGTINYEIVTRVGGRMTRVARRYLGRETADVSRPARASAGRSTGQLTQGVLR